MSATKMLWESEVDKIGDEYANGKIVFDEAFRRMVSKGFLPDEAEEHLGALEMMRRGNTFVDDFNVLPEEHFYRRHWFGFISAILIFMMGSVILASALGGVGWLLGANKPIVVALAGSGALLGPAIIFYLANKYL